MYHSEEIKRKKIVPISTEKKISRAASTSALAPVNPLGIPSKFRDIAENCSQMAKWDKKQIVGKGQYGAIYVACMAENCEYILKEQPATTVFHNEIQALLDLQFTGVVPKVYAAWTCNEQGYMVLQKLYPCNLSVHDRYDQVKKALELIYKAGWVHVDTHRSNYMCDKDGKKAYIIDFGWAAKRGPDGDAQKYPYHPLSIKYKKPVTWEFLRAGQWRNFNKSFNPKDSDDLRRKDEEALDDYHEAAAKLT